MTEPGGPIRVFLMDDHEVVRRGVQELLEVEPDIVVVGEASTAAEALVRVPALRPDVAVLDVRLPDGDGITVCRELRSQLPDLACLMLTSFSDDEALFDAIMAGAAGYVLKQIRGSDLVGAVRVVAAGGSLLDPRTIAQVMDKLRGGGSGAPADPLADLTEREREILTLIGEGMTNRQIGDRLHPGREDHQELCLEPAGQARHGAAYPGGCSRRRHHAVANDSTDRAGQPGTTATVPVLVPAVVPALKGTRRRPVTLPPSIRA